MNVCAFSYNLGGFSYNLEAFTFRWEGNLLVASQNMAAARQALGSEAENDLNDSHGELFTQKNCETIADLASREVSGQEQWFICYANISPGAPAGCSGYTCWWSSVETPLCTGKGTRSGGKRGGRSPGPDWPMGTHHCEGRPKGKTSALTDHG